MFMFRFDGEVFFVLFIFWKKIQTKIISMSHNDCLVLILKFFDFLVVVYRQFKVKKVFDFL